MDTLVSDQQWDGWLEYITALSREEHVEDGWSTVQVRLCVNIHIQGFEIGLKSIVFAV